MNILITGGTGFVGSHLVEHFTRSQHHVTILTRSRPTRNNNPFLTYRQWDGIEMPPALGFNDVVINLAGSSIAGGRWSDSYKAKIRESRVKATQACVNYINNSVRPPHTFVSASATGFYGGNREEVVDEKSEPAHDFLGVVSQEWEATAKHARCRTLIVRFGLILGKDGGLLPQMVTPYKFWLGGSFGDGKQGFPWVHIDDVVGSIQFLIDREDASGPFNIVAPERVDQSTFSAELADALGVMEIWKVPEFALKLGLGEKSVLLWGGQKVEPARLAAYDYPFRFPTLKAALEDLIDG